MWRADRWATVHLFHPLSKQMPRRRTHVPILMYHSISDCSQPGVHPYYQTTTTPAVFAQHMRFLHENGYVPVTLADALSELGSPQDSSKRPVVITFDDGFEDFYTDAFPVLSSHSFTATMFLPTAYIGMAPRTCQSTRCLTWAQVRELAGAGIHFGAHTETNPRLVQLR